MKKVLLFLFIFGFALSSTCQAFFNYQNQKTTVSETIPKDSQSFFKFSKRIAIILKADLIDDFDTEDEVCNSLLFKSKYPVVTTYFFKNSTSVLSIVCKSTNCVGYFNTNLSRIPRFNYISLNVFLI